MNLYKKLGIVFLSIFMLFAFSSTAYASSADDIISALSQAGVPGDQISKAVEYLQRVNVTPAQANAIIGNINAASAALGGQRDLTKVSPEVKQTIKNYIGASIGILGLNADYSNTNSDGSAQVVVDDASGNTIISADTGSGSNMIKNFDPSALKDAIVASQNFSQSSDKSKFDAVDGVQMKNTGTNYGNMMLVGGLLIISSVAMLAFRRRI